MIKFERPFQNGDFQGSIEVERHGSPKGEVLEVGLEDLSKLIAMEVDEVRSFCIHRCKAWCVRGRKVPRIQIFKKLAQIVTYLPGVTAAPCGDADQESGDQL